MLRYITGPYCVIFSGEMQPFSELKKDQTRTICQDNTGPAMTGIPQFSSLCFICASWHHTLTTGANAVFFIGWIADLPWCLHSCQRFVQLSLVHLSDW